MDSVEGSAVHSERGASTVTSATENHKRAYDWSSSLEPQPSDEKATKRQKNHLGHTHEYRPGVSIVHQVECSGSVAGHGQHHSGLYLDQPRLFTRDTKASALRGSERIESSLEDYLVEEIGAKLIVLRSYSCTAYAAAIEREFEFMGLPNVDARSAAFIRPYFYVLQSSDLKPANPYKETIQLSYGLESAMQQLSEAEPHLLPDWQESLHPPYLQIYPARDQIRACAPEVLGESAQDYILNLLEYVEDLVGAEYRRADSLFAQGLVNKEHISKLFGPNELVVTKDDGEPAGYISEVSPVSTADGGLVLPRCYHWTFDGIFHREEQSLTITWPANKDEPIPITDLTVYPLRFDSSGSMEHHLRDRGNMFWSCRGKNLVAAVTQSTSFEDRVVNTSFPRPQREERDSETRLYLGREKRTIFRFAIFFLPFPLCFFLHSAQSFANKIYMQSNPRYMIDTMTYHELHNKKERSRIAEEEKSQLSSEVMNFESPPDGPFVLLLPARILGFGMHDKKWSEYNTCCKGTHLWGRPTNGGFGTGTLLVKNLRRPVWNKRAFNQLVLDPQKKELMEAMIKIHIQSSMSTDVIEGKGNGLIILLHGGPGTGKTLTAESVAELAEKPLYRVTCGDIGTSPESVEQYLESVLYIGTTWKAGESQAIFSVLGQANRFLKVLLLDESDVFLEEREKTDLQRNALVSVFLRALEYYEGILILTSNRGESQSRATYSGYTDDVNSKLAFSTKLSSHGFSWLYTILHLTSEDDGRFGTIFSIYCDDSKKINQLLQMDCVILDWQMAKVFPLRNCATRLTCWRKRNSTVAKSAMPSRQLVSLHASVGSP